MKKKKSITPVRQEIYHPYSGRFSLKPIEGFTEGKTYGILSESATRSYLYHGIDYLVVDDNGKRRNVNCNYFTPPEPRLLEDDNNWAETYTTIAKKALLEGTLEKPTSPYCIDWNALSLDIPDIRQQHIKQAASNSLYYSGIVPAIPKELQLPTTLEAKAEYNLGYKEANVLAGTKARQFNPFHEIEAQIANIERTAKGLLTLAEKITKELETIKKLEPK